MTQVFRLVFDDCLSKNAVEALKMLARFSRGAVEFAHLADFSLQGMIDDDWIPKIDAEGWVVATTDRGKNPSRGGKLPILCREHRLTHIMFSAALHKRNQFDKLRAMFEVWPELANLVNAPRGSGYSLQCTSRGSARLVLKYSPTKPTKRPVQKRLALSDESTSDRPPS